MVCLEELLVVMTNGLKIVKIRTRNMAAFMNKSAKTTTRLSRHSLSLAPGKRRRCVLDELGRRSFET